MCLLVVVVDVRTVGVYLCLAFVWLKHSLRGKLHINPLTELKNTTVCDFYLHEASHMRHPLITKQNSIAEDCFAAAQSWEITVVVVHIPSGLCFAFSLGAPISLIRR